MTSHSPASSPSAPDHHPPHRCCDCTDCASYFAGNPISNSDGAIYAKSGLPQGADALREAPAVSYTEREMYEMQREGTLPDVQAWLTYCKGEPNVQPELRRRFGWCQFHTPVWMPLVFQRAALAHHQAPQQGEPK